MASLDAEAAAAAADWASELSSAAWTEMDETDERGKRPATRTKDGARMKRGQVDKSLKSAVANDYEDVDGSGDMDDDFSANYYDYDADDVEEDYVPGSAFLVDDDDDDADADGKARARKDGGGRLGASGARFPTTSCRGWPSWAGQTWVRALCSIG